MTEESNWELLSFILASKYRMKILKTLLASPHTPKEISQKTNIRISHVSAVLKTLSEKSLVTCLTPSARKGKLYVATDKAKELIQRISE